MGKIEPGRENKPHIGIYGRCNVGKSSLLNFITESDIAIVSSHSGTTTDPVRKSYEILDFAPVIFIDTAGFDDISELGAIRVRKTFETLSQIDMAILVYKEWGSYEKNFEKQLQLSGIPYIKVFNDGKFPDRDFILEEIKKNLPEKSYKIPSIFEGKVSENDIVFLVCPIDSEAPAGRLILPQVQAVRALLDKHAVAVVVQPEQIFCLFDKGIQPSLVVTDSQIFKEVKEIIPSSVEVTSFSILLAAAKGDYKLYLQGLDHVDKLKNGDKVLIVENCSHQVSCDDIGRVKIPKWLREYTGLDLNFTFVSGLAPLPADIGNYTLMVQCGGCMVTRSQLLNRIRVAQNNGVAVTNYGMLIKKLRLG